MINQEFKAPLELIQEKSTTYSSLLISTNAYASIF